MLKSGGCKLGVDLLRGSGAWNSEVWLAAFFCSGGGCRQGEVGVGNVDEAADGEERKEIFEGDTVAGGEGEVIIKRLRRFPGHCQYRSNLELCCCG